MLRKFKPTAPAGGWGEQPGPAFPFHVPQSAVTGTLLSTHTKTNELFRAAPTSAPSAFRKPPPAGRVLWEGLAMALHRGDRTSREAASRPIKQPAAPANDFKLPCPAIAEKLPIALSSTDC